MRALLGWGTVLLLAASLPCRAEGFAFEVASPKFKVTIPGIPQMKMEVHPKNASQPQLRFLGFADPYAVAIFTPAAVGGMTSLECAGAIARTRSRPALPVTCTVPAIMSTSHHRSAATSQHRRPAPAISAV